MAIPISPPPVAHFCMIGGRENCLSTKRPNSAVLCPLSCSYHHHIVCHTLRQGTPPWTALCFVCLGAARPSLRLPLLVAAPAEFLFAGYFMPCGRGGPHDYNAGAAWVPPCEQSVACCFLSPRPLCVAQPPNHPMCGAQFLLFPHHIIRHPQHVPRLTPAPLTGSASFAIVFC